MSGKVGIRPLLVTGGSGQVGGAVARLARAAGRTVWAPPRAELDLADPAALARAVASGQPAAVINCAAYTAVDKAESEEALAFAINADAPAALAAACAAAGIPLVQVSTDYVFDGTKPAPYLETDAIAPLGVYGRSKAAGEAAVRAAAPRHAIVRTAWVLSAGPGNFLDTMLRLAGERSSLNVVDDQIGCPTSASDLAAALLAIADRLGARSGIWHCVNGGEASWFALAGHIFAEAARRGLPVPEVNPIRTAQYPTPAARPANSRLDCGRLSANFGLVMRPWQDAVSAILAERLGKA